LNISTATKTVPLASSALFDFQYFSPRVAAYTLLYAISPVPNLSFKMLIKIDDIKSTPAVLALISLHVAEINRMVDSCDVLDVSSLQASNVTFYSAWEGPELMGIGALKELSPTHGEVKSMRTVEIHSRKGVGRAIVEHLINVAKERGYTRLSLETGKDASFESARGFYTNMGFELCDPYGELPPCPDSSFMTLKLEGQVEQPASLNGR
jgi:putative acetyltransferase